MTHEIRLFLDGCDGSGQIVWRGTYARCRSMRRRMERRDERRGHTATSYSIFAAGEPDGGQYTLDQAGRKVCHLARQ